MQDLVEYHRYYCYATATAARCTTLLRTVRPLLATNV
jgi:hypothetical protein